MFYLLTYFNFVVALIPKRESVNVKCKAVLPGISKWAVKICFGQKMSAPSFIFSVLMYNDRAFVLSALHFTVSVLDERSPRILTSICSLSGKIVLVLGWVFFL